jgi:hypothetical protein
MKLTFFTKQTNVKKFKGEKFNAMHLVLAENALEKRIFDVLENKLSATHGDWVTLFSSCIKMPKQEFHSLNVAQICSTLSLPTYYHLVACLFECQKNLYLLRSVS